MRKLYKEFCGKDRIPLYDLPDFKKNPVLYYVGREIEETFSYLLDTIHSNFCEVVAMGRKNFCWRVPSDLEIDETCKCYES